MREAVGIVGGDVRGAGSDSVLHQAVSRCIARLFQLPDRAALDIQLGHGASMALGIACGCFQHRGDSIWSFSLRFLLCLGLRGGVGSIEPICGVIEQPSAAGSRKG